MSYLDRRGEDLEALHDICDWPTEFLRDPSSWLEADKMEHLLEMINQQYPVARQGEEMLMEAVGHSAKDLRAWGVLDSVLRMVQTPKDLFSQPERLLSYFISPAPPIGEMRRENESVRFVLPVSEEQFPLVTGYLRAALEALPSYINKPMAQVVWDNSRVKISWSENQTSLFSEGQEADLSLHPELLRNILMNLETSQKDLEAMKVALIERDQKIESLEAALVTGAATQEPDVALAAPLSVPGIEANLAALLHDLFRLGDYFARSQQLITLLIAQGRQTPQVKEAMRRVDWDFVVQEGPQTVRRLVSETQSMLDQHKINGGLALPSVRSTTHTKLADSSAPSSRSSRSSPSQKTFEGLQRSPSVHP